MIWKKLVKTSFFLFYAVLDLKNVLLDLLSAILRAFSAGFIEAVGKGEEKLGVENEIPVG